MGKCALIQVRCTTALAAVVLLPILVCSVTAVETVHGQTPLGTWTMKSPTPTVRAEVAAVALDGTLHALGGVVDGSSAPTHDEYDPTANSWRTRAPLPELRDHLAVATGSLMRRARSMSFVRAQILRSDMLTSENAATHTKSARAAAVSIEKQLQAREIPRPSHGQRCGLMGTG